MIFGVNEIWPIFNDTSTAEQLKMLNNIFLSANDSNAALPLLKTRFSMLINFIKVFFWTLVFKKNFHYTIILYFSSVFAPTVLFTLSMKLFWKNWECAYQIFICSWAALFLMFQNNLTLNFRHWQVTKFEWPLIWLMVREEFRISKCKINKQIE